MIHRDREALVLGLGNILWADEGFGVRCLEALHETYAFPPAVTLADGGTLGLALLELVSGSRRLLVFDAIDFGDAPGSLRVLRDGEVPACAKRKLSPHQNGFNDVLALAGLHGRAPEAITVIGVQPVELGDFGGSLTPPVKARLAEAVARAVAELAAWGFGATPRSDAAKAESIMAGSLALDAYERGRPSADDACRIGDPRVLERARLQGDD